MRKETLLNEEKRFTFKTFENIASAIMTSAEFAFF